MWAFIDQYREALGVEPICRMLQIAPSGYRRHAARQRDPARRSARVQRDEARMHPIQRIWDANRQVYGVDKVWRQLQREGLAAARYTVARLMRQRGLRGIRRGQAVRTTVPNLAAPCPGDRVNRHLCHSARGLSDSPHRGWCDSPVMLLMVDANVMIDCLKPMHRFWPWPLAIWRHQSSQRDSG